MIYASTIARILTLVGLALVFTKCSYFRAMGSPSAKYNSYVDSRLDQKTLYDRGTLTVDAKVIAVDDGLKNAQEEMSPSASVKIPEDKLKVLVAVNYPVNPHFRPKHFKYFLGDVESSWSKEIYNESLVKSLYKFSYPFYRLISVEFKKKDQDVSFNKPFYIRTPSGELKFDLKKGRS